MEDTYSYHRVSSMSKKTKPSKTTTTVTTVTTTVTTTVDAAPKPFSTYVAMILDESGSMDIARTSIIGHFKEQIDMLLEQQKEDPDHKIKVSLTKFNSTSSIAFDNLSPVEVPLLTLDTYKPSGGTALYDAVGQTINRIKETVDFTKEDVSILVLIFSDGEENSSRVYNSPQVAAMIKDCKDSKKWTFTYMGSSSSSLEDIAKKMNIDLGNMASFNTSSVAGYSMGSSTVLEGTKAYLNVRSKFAKGAMGQSADIGTYQSTSFFDIEGENKKFKSPENIIIPS